MDKAKKRQDLIVDGAREVFLEKGLFNTVMEDIADRVGLSRRTLYRYFKTKEDLAYEVTIELLKEWNHYQENTYRKLEGRGLERLEDFLINLTGYMADRVEVMAYLGEFDFYFKDNIVTQLKVDRTSRFDNIILLSDEILEDIIILGQEDGSIEKDLDLDLTVATMSNILWAFGQRIAIRNKTMIKEYGYSGIDLIKNQIAIYITAIRRM